MTFGKKERMVAVIVVILGLAAAIHFLIFQKKAKAYDSTSQEYKTVVEQLTTAEFIGDQQAQFEEYKQRTSQYSDLVTSVVDELNLQKLDLPTSPPVGAVDRWASQTIELLTQLNAQRGGQVELTFLGPNGWDLPAQLPSVGGTGALADRVSQFNQVFQQLQYTAGNPGTEAQIRAQYNQRLTQLGINPQQTSKFVYPQYRLYFNNEEWIKTVLSQSNAGRAGDLQPYYNWYGLQRFGQAIPALKKIWMYALISRELQTQNPETLRMDPNMLPRFAEALEIGIPLGDDEPLNSINKQLRALLDMIDIASRTGIKEIAQVKLLRPVNVAKATLRIPGQTPSAEATPTPTPAGGGMMGGMGMMYGGMYGMGEMGGMGINAGATATPVPDADRVGTGAGIELSLRADNASLARFYYQLSHVPRTYGLDDLYVYNTPEGLYTTATVEVITDVNLEGGSASATGAP